MGSLRIPFTGRLYPVRPMSVFRWCDYLEALSRLAGLGAPEDEGEALMWLSSLPIGVLRPLAAVMIASPVRGRDLDRIDRAQMESLLVAVGRVNDLAYISAEMAPRKSGGAAASEAWGMEDTVDAIVAARPCYTHDDLFRMPVQKFLSIAKTVERRARDRKFAEEGVGGASVPYDAEPCTDEEKAGVAAHLRDMGVRC